MSIAETAASAAIGLGIDLATTDWKQRKQFEQQERLQRLKMQGDKEMSSYNAQVQKQLGLEMWNETNAEAQRKHYEKAGLNVGLMYPGGGGGGITASSSPGSVQGANANEPNIGMGMQLGLQAAQTAAQTELTKAQTENVKADTVKKAGVDTQEVGARIANLAQQTENAGVQKEIMLYDKELKSLETGIKTLTFDTAVKTIEENYNKLKGEAEKATNEGKMTTEAYEQMLSELKQGTIERAARIAAIKEGTEFNFGSDADKARWVKMATDALGTIMSPVKLGIKQN